MAKSSLKLILRNVRGSHVHVERAVSIKNEDGTDGAPAFSIQCILGKDHPQLDQLRETFKTVATEAFGTTRGIKCPIRDGDGEDEKEYEERKGCLFFNAKMNETTRDGRKQKPGILNRRKETPSEEDLEDYCYSGAYFHVSVSLYDYDHPRGGKGVAVGLNNVMLFKKGDRLDGRVSAAGDFSEVEAETDDDDEFGLNDELEDDDIPF